MKRQNNSIDGNDLQYRVGPYTQDTTENGKENVKNERNEYRVMALIVTRRRL